MNRTEFPVKIRRAAWERSGGCCEECGHEFTRHPKDRPQYDHRVPDALGGEPTLENCKVLCRGCHLQKTTKQDVPMIAKAARGERKRRGLEGRKAVIPGSRRSDFKKRLDGTVERRHD